MDLIGRKLKIWERISSGKHPHRIDLLLSDIAPISEREKERTNECKRGEACVLVQRLLSVEEWRK